MKLDRTGAIKVNGFFFLSIIEHTKKRCNLELACLLVMFFIRLTVSTYAGSWYLCFLLMSLTTKIYFGFMRRQVFHYSWLRR